MDIEVLDAISFKTKRGEEIVMNVPGAEARPYIIDQTGDGNSKSTPGATRRSLMKRLTGSFDSSQIFDIEVLDAIAFNDQNGQEWILSFPDDSDVYNSTTDTGSRSATRRVHDEKIYSDPTDKTSPYLTVTRCDTMSFKKVRGEEMVLNLPSSDDGSGTGRASTYCTPQNYVPNVTIPPDNTDPSVYIFFPPSSKGAMSGNTKIACGPLWWPRATSLKSGPWYTFTPIQQPYQWSLFTDNGQYIWVGNPADSSFAGTPSTETWQRLPNVGVGYDNGTEGSIGLHHPGPALDPIGFATLDDAIEHGQIGVDWGVIDFTDTRIDPGAQDGRNKNYCDPGVSGTPDIWQLSKVEPPALIPPPDPAGKWTAGSQSTALQAQVANAYLNAWNGTSNAWNEEMAGAAGTLTNLYWYIDWPPLQRFGNGNIPRTYSYPTTDFGVPLPNELTSPVQGAGCFLGGMSPGYWIGHWGTLDGEVPAFALVIGVAQLDPSKWDTSDAFNPKLKASSA